jgi:hypothetical protein
MVIDADLLQANATIITGILIFLTLAPYSRSSSAKEQGWLGVLWAVYMTVVLLAGSIFFILFNAEFSTFTKEMGGGFVIAKILFSIGLIGVAVTIILVTRLFLMSKYH